METGKINNEIKIQQKNTVPEIVQRELGINNLENVKRIVETVKRSANKLNIETHLLLVGGNVRPEKRGKYHKDVDLVLYSPQLATEVYFGGEHPKFDKFAKFIGDISDELGWKIETENPWFFEHEHCGDGKVTLLPGGNEKPIEVLPVRQSSLNGSFEGYLKSETDPYVILL
ncbi:MAG: hypothetical protein PHX34_05930 [Candidatus Shapirobacteria bacterium]|nr:hypothetical protein [Candidatus Shapirobacteria bacterium]